MNPAQEGAADHLLRVRSSATLQAPGNDRYQRTWLVPVSLPRSCLRIRLDLGDGEAHEINARLF